MQRNDDITSSWYSLFFSVSFPIHYKIYKKKNKTKNNHSDAESFLYDERKFWMNNLPPNINKKNTFYFPITRSHLALNSVFIFFIIIYSFIWCTFFFLHNLNYQPDFWPMLSACLGQDIFWFISPFLKFFFRFHLRLEFYFFILFCFELNEYFKLIFTTSISAFVVSHSLL